MLVKLVCIVPFGEFKSRWTPPCSCTKVSVPVSDIVAPGISSVGVGAMDIHMTALLSHKNKSGLWFSIPDERVIGVRYRKVKFNLFSSKKLENGCLENNPNCWRIFSRGARGSSIDDVLEVELGTTELDDLDLNEEMEFLDENTVFLP